jgi:uncharacterized protein (DUF1684 family)
MVDGKAVSEATLSIDATKPESDCPTKIAVGDRLKLQLVRRTGRLAIRVRDSQSELLQSFRGKAWFDVKPEYRVLARFEPYDKAKLIKITNVKGDQVDTPLGGVLHFEWQGQSLSLDAIQESPKSLFVIFKDGTSGKSTYGAGRFVDVDLPADSDGHVVLDFNKAYSPPCAWNSHTLCPLPPKQNHLPIVIEAGERQLPK